MQIEVKKRKHRRRRGKRSKKTNLYSWSLEIKIENGGETRRRRLRNTKKFKLLYCEKSENKIKVEHPKKFKLLYLRTCTHEVFEIKIAALICSSTFCAYNMLKNILNHYTTQKMGIGSNEHVGEALATQKMQTFALRESRNRNLQHHR